MLFIFTSDPFKIITSVKLPCVLFVFLSTIRKSVLVILAVQKLKVTEK